MKVLKRLLFLMLFIAAALFVFTGTTLAAEVCPGKDFANLDPDFDPCLAPLPAHPGIPTDNPSGTNVWPSKMGPKQELGYLVLFDPKLAGDPSLSCADCHDPKQGWSFADTMSKGYPGSVHFRGSQTLVNTGYHDKFFWQGGSPSLEKQAPSAAGGAQSGNGSRDVMETRLRFSPEYVKRFKEVFGTEWPLIRDAWRAMAAFERWLSQPNTPFDRFLKGEKDAISAKAKKGLDLFVGKAGCIECHNGPTFNDGKFYKLGLPQPAEYLESGLHQTGLKFRTMNKGEKETLWRVAKDDLLYYFNTKRPQDMGKSRTGPLRYIEFTAPYMHNGLFFTLEEVVDFYNEGGGENQWTKPNQFNPCGAKTKALKPLNLTDDEKEALVEFLLTLDDEEALLPVPEVPAYAAMPDSAPSKARVAEDLLRWKAAAQAQ